MFTSYSRNIHFNIIVPSLRSFRWLLSSNFSTKILYLILIFLIRVNVQPKVTTGVIYLLEYKFIVQKVPYTVRTAATNETDHHAMMAYWGSGGIAPLIL
jgi:hypothetical protein